MTAVIPTLLLVTRLIIDTDHVLARFDPRSALGATKDVNGRIFTPKKVAAMLSAGFQPLSYRLATELASEAWHWNPTGTWSDPAHHQGYWTSSATSPDSITASYGYRLPRRGNTIDQSAENHGYSRVDDGDLSTFWKSNPYLGDRPQWLLVDLAAPRRVNSIRITWADPFAVDYQIEYWTGCDPINGPADGQWITFGGGDVRGAKGGETQTAMREPPYAIRFVRILMTRSSHTAPREAEDARDHVGFAIAEVSVGRGDVDYVRHAPSHDRQTVIWVSSTDPWHRAIDIDPTMEQPGFDVVFRSGLTRGLPMLTPVALLYGTPEDAVSEIRFLRSRGYSVTQIEMGEEPDGQNISPEDYAALYMQWADALHAVDPTLRLGGPAFQSTNDTVAFWPDAHGRTSWIGRFVDALRRQNRLDDFSFFSFEWYPFDNVCGDAHAQLVEAPAILDRVLARWRAEGAPTNIPWVATEYGWSSFAAEAEVDITGALFDAEFVAQFLASGGAAAYFYGYEIKELARAENCPTYGGLMLFLGGAKLPVYYAARLLTREWLLPSGTHELHAVRGTSKRLRAFAVRRPDSTWALLIINKARQRQSVAASGEVIQYSRSEHVRNVPPRRFRAQREIELPPESITVVRLTPPAP